MLFRSAIVGVVEKGGPIVSAEMILGLLAFFVIALVFYVGFQIGCWWTNRRN